MYQWKQCSRDNLSECAHEKYFHNQLFYAALSVTEKQQLNVVLALSVRRRLPAAVSLHCPQMWEVIGFLLFSASRLIGHGDGGRRCGRRVVPACKS